MTDLYSSWLLERLVLGEVVRLRFGVTTIGRHQSSMIRIIESEYVSRNHSEIEISADDSRITIRDLNSVNGVYVNENIFNGAVAQLQAGDRIGIGVTIENENSLEHAVYMVRYLPIRRVPNRPLAVVATPNNSNQASTSKMSAVKKEPVSTNDSNQASTSKMSVVKNEPMHNSNSQPLKTTTTSQIAIIIISDDDDEEEETKKNEVCNIDVNSRLTPPPSNTSDSSSESEPLRNSTEEPAVHCPIVPAIKHEIARNTTEIIKSIFGETDDVIMDQMKQIDPYTYNNLNGKPIHLPTTRNEKEPTLRNGDSICLLSDDEEIENENCIESLGQLFVTDESDERAKSSKNIARSAKSPNLFDSSLNSSIDKNEETDFEKHKTVGTSLDRPKGIVTGSDNTGEREIAQEKPKDIVTSSDKIKENAVDKLNEIVTSTTKIKDKALQTSKEVVTNSDKDIPKEVVTGLHQIEEKPQEKRKEVVTILSQIIKLPVPTIVATKNDAEDYNSYEPRSDDEDIEELMFSQVIIDDMKAEMANDNNKEDNSSDIIAPYINPTDMQPETSASVLDSSSWLLSDDETDEEQEKTVSNWKKKIFSQSFSSMSQVFEDSLVYDYNSQENDESTDDNDTDTDLYNRVFADPDKICNEVFDSLVKIESCDSSSSTIKGDDAVDELDNLDLQSNSTFNSPIIKQRSVIRKLVSSSSDDEQEETTNSTCKDLNSDSPLIKCRNRLTRRVLSNSDDDEQDAARKNKKISETVEEQEIQTKKNLPKDQPKSLKRSNERKKSDRPDTTSDKAKQNEGKKIMELPIKSITTQDQTTIHLLHDQPSKSKYINERRSSERPEKMSIGNVQVSRRNSHNIIDRTSIDAEIPPMTSEKIHAPSVGCDVASKSHKRGPPMIIDAPQLPRFKGKLRGVSAVTLPPPPQPSLIAAAPSAAKSMPTSGKRADLEKKASAVREIIRHDQILKDLKQKWDKPCVAPKPNSEHKVNIKKRLKDLSDKQKQEKERNEREKREPLKRETSTEEKTKKPKVKVTTANRGAFLAEEYKIPKITPKSRETSVVNFLDGPSTSAAAAAAANVRVHNKSKTSANDAGTGGGVGAPKNILKRKSSTEKQLIGTFSQHLAMADDVLGVKCTNARGSADNIQYTQAPPVCRTEATVARAQRTTNKITFASMQKNFIESHQNQKKLDSINTRSCLSEGRCAASSSAKRTKKTVRFNDTPIVHYIDSVKGACKKVDKKDIEPRSSHHDRYLAVRNTYKKINCNDEIISLILRWSNDYLLRGNAAVEGVGEALYLIPTQFSSFDHYKSVIFPLMKLEFLTELEREYKACIASGARPIRVVLEVVTEYKDRRTLITKLQYQKNHHEAVKCDIAILDFGSKKTYAYLSAHRKSASCQTLVYEVNAINFGIEFLKTFQNKEIKVLPVMDNVRVEFGALNAVFQLPQTPLFQKILNPLELLKGQRPRPKKIFKGYDPLNDHQKEVLLSTYTRAIDETTPSITLIKGPPGTGKSCVITNLALQLLYGDDVRTLDKKILICAQSNVAVDVIAQKLVRIQKNMSDQKRFRAVRYGIFDKINSNVQSISLQKLVESEQLRKLQAHNQNIQIENKENMRNQTLQLEAQIAEMKSRNIKGTVQQDELLEKQRQLQLMRDITSHTLRPEDERSLHQWLLRNANIVCATLSSCVKLSQFVEYFDICIIDEATQCTEPYTLLPLKFFINSLVLVGDTMQLPATVLSKKATEFGLTTSLFSRIQNCLDTVRTANISKDEGNGIGATPTIDLVVCGLKTQYRMHPEICKWPNLYFYSGGLINDKSTLTNHNTKITPFSVLNLTYSQNDNCVNGKIQNDDEAVFVAKLLKALDGHIPTKYNSYGVITPYANHRDTLAISIRSYGLTNIMVNTIDSYQGVEKDVIIISNARTNGVGFLSNQHRLNVAVTRPRRCLILVGNFKNVESVPAWGSLLNNARERNLFHEISATCLRDIQRNVIDKIMVKR